MQEQSHVTADIDRNVLSIKTLADDSSVGSQHAVHGITQLVNQLSDLDRLVRQFQKTAPASQSRYEVATPAPFRFAKPDNHNTNNHRSKTLWAFGPMWFFNARQQEGGTLASLSDFPLH